MPGGRQLRRVVLGLCLSMLLPPAPQPAEAWEARTRRLVVTRAVDTLPYPLRAFYENHRNTIGELSERPDQWGGESNRPEHGYIRLETYGRYPFVELPRDYNAAVRKFGRRKLVENGTLPWEIAGTSLKLEEAFRAQQWDKVKLYSAILAREVVEAHDPFNTTLNQDGHLSGQTGVDQRYGSSLVDRYQMFFIIRPGGAYRISDPTQQAFGIVLESNTWVDNILYADAKARSGKIDYNDEYYDAFYDAVGAVLIRQLTDASLMVGSHWYTAWLNAGRPALPAE